MIKEGTLWGSADGKVFRVIKSVVIEGKEWVHYICVCDQCDPSSKNREYSCYEESFLLRFTQRPE